MPFNGSGTYVRTENWSNDAANNLAISATKFDTEANDMASAFGLCLTRDGQGAPSGALTWAQTLTLNRGTDGTELTVGRTGGSNNPALQVQVADATGITLNTSIATALALSINGTAALTIASTGTITLAKALTVSSGGLTVTAGGATITAGGLTVSGGGAAVTGNSTVTGTLTVSAALTAQNALTVSAGGATITAGGLTVSAGGAAITGNTSVAGGTFASRGISDSATANALTITSGGLVEIIDDGGTLQVAGYRGVPINTQSVNYTAVLADRGKLINHTTTGDTVTVPANVFSAGDVLSIATGFTAGSITIAQGVGLTIYWANGSGNTSGNRTLTAIGVATLVFTSATSANITGSGLS